MPLIRPFLSDDDLKNDLSGDSSANSLNESIIEKAVEDAIELRREKEFVSNSRDNAPGEKLQKAQKAFGKSGAALNDIASEVARILRNGESDNVRLSAARLSLEVHGIIRELENNKTAQIPAVNIQIVQSHSQSQDGSKNIFSILVPNE